MIPFSSKSCWCLKVKDCPSLSFLTKTKDERSKSYHCLATWRGKRSVNQLTSELCPGPRQWSSTIVPPYHFQQVLLQRFHSGQWLHLQHATRPVNQSRLTWCSLQAETQPPRQDLRSKHEHRVSSSYRRNALVLILVCQEVRLWSKWDSLAGCIRSLECRTGAEVDVLLIPGQQSVFGLRQRLVCCREHGHRL